jgi:FkbM family methyltransferase
MKITKFLLKVLRLIDQQGLMALAGKAHSIASFQIMEGVGAHCPKLSTILDVGANEGQFAAAANRKFPAAKIISFEPLPELHETFLNKLGQNRQITIHNLALGNEKGTIDFYKNEHSGASSALVISEEQKAAIPGTSKTTKVQVKVDRLDSFAKELKLDGPLLLKLDVQGYERRVLEGATSLLPTVDYILFEASFVRMYENEPLFAEMHEFLGRLGFEVVGPVGFLEASNNLILQMDFLYRNVRKSSTG